MNTLQIPCKSGEVSDGYHTFDELYKHRHCLFLTVMKLVPHVSWASQLHSDGTSFEGWFIAGVCLPTGEVTYHMPMNLWQTVRRTGAKILNKAPYWDGHTSLDCIQRLEAWLEQ